MSAHDTGRTNVKVWDLLVRAGHWALLIGIFAAWFTQGKWHEWLGYAVLGIVLVRIVWGLIGSRYARFTQFVRSPAATLDYTGQILAHREPRHLGHNPLGGWMTVVLLIMITAVCATGWLFTTDRFWGVEWVEELHEWLTNAMFALVALHVCGVIFSSIRHGENLEAAMFSGRKRAPADNDVA